MNDLPSYISFTFATCVIATFGFIYYAIHQAGGSKSRVVLISTSVLVIWIALVSLITTQGFFRDYEVFPPRLMVGVALMALTIITLFIIPGTRNFLAQMPISTLTYIHIIRVPVEIVLWWLFVFGTVDVAMTFKGYNYDILSGISAPFAGLFFVGLKSKNYLSAIIWNIITLGLLINIVRTAILATPYFFEHSGLEQQNTAVFYFPFILLPLFIVPAVFFSHLVSLYQLLFVKKMDT